MTIHHRIAELKKDARKHYEAYRAIADRYDCGLALAEHLNPQLRGHAEMFNAAMDQLAELDPAAPRSRL